MQTYINCITGNFINFAICEYYQDDTFSQLSQFILKSVTSVDIKVVTQYEKIHKKLYSLIENTFKNHLELVFMKFDFTLIQNILNLLIIGVTSEQFDVASSACMALDCFNDYVYTQLKHPKKK